MINKIKRVIKINAAVKQTPIRIPDYSETEERINSITHLLGALFGVTALLLMAPRAGDLPAILCVLAYGLAIITLYSTSSLYHAVPGSDPAKGAFRVADHCMVFVLVLGTCTPVFLLGIGGVPGWILFGVVAISSVLGVVMTLWDMDRTETLCTVLHLLNGWSVVLGFHWLRSAVGAAGVAWLLAGGIVYTLGVIFFVLGAKKPYMHGVFHIFCLAGTVLQFVGVYGYVL